MIKKKIKDLDKFDFEHKTDIIYFRNNKLFVTSYPCFNNMLFLK